MKENLTEIVILHDDEFKTNYSKDALVKHYTNFFSLMERSGKEKNAEVNCTLITYGSKHMTIFENKKLENIKAKSIGNNPNGSHPVFDSAARAIDETGVRYSETPEELRPSKVIFVLSCFGKDNASKSNTANDIKERIIHQSDVYKWKFFLLTNNVEYSEEFSEACVINFDNDEDGYLDKALSVLSEKIHEYLDEKILENVEAQTTQTEQASQTIIDN